MSRYPWKRFWAPREGQINLSDQGFLADPESESGWYSPNPDLQAFGEIAALPCLVLLGEPGIGKSTAIDTERNTVEAEARELGDAVLQLDLRSVHSEQTLNRRIFDIPAFKNWEAGDHHLHLFLDSLDEALLEANSLASFFVDELRPLDLARLTLRIACRTAEWPETVTAQLTGLWGEDRVGIFELAPLRRRDVEQALEIEGMDAQSFIAEAIARGVVPLVINPVTLGLLIDEYRSHALLPTTQASLYRRGLLALCEERDPTRIERGEAGNLSPAQRIAVAKRLAAVTIFAARDLISLAPGGAPTGSAAAAVKELVGGEEPVSEEAGAPHVAVNEAAVRETVGTGLFSARGANLFGFGHQTYAEFLAACYVLDHGMSADDVLTLLTSPGDPEQHVVPQLHEVAGWLATLEPMVFRAMLVRDPIVLLRSDVQLADPSEREQLVAQILDLSLEQDGFEARAYYYKLGHPLLSKQLEPIVTDKDAHWARRRTAVDIAEECVLRDLQGVLATIALDTTEEHTVRVDAAYAVTRLGDIDTKKRLAPLLTLAPDEDPDDELKGCALCALWPQSLRAEAVLPELTPPRQPNLLGAYYMFLSQGFVRDLNPSDLPNALEWARAQPRGHRQSVFDDLIDQIILAAVTHLGNPQIAEALAQTATSFLARDYRLIAGTRGDEIGKTLLENVERRRRLVECMVPYLVTGELKPSHLAFAQERLVQPSDTPWLLEKLDGAAGAAEGAWAGLIETAFRPGDPTFIEDVLEARERSDALRELLSPYLDTVELSSPHATELRDRHMRYKLREQEDERLTELDPPLEERVATSLTRFEQGEVDAWWRLTLELSREEATPTVVNLFKSDIHTSPAWRDADAALRDRLTAAASLFLRLGDPRTEDWFGTNQMQRAAIAGFCALRLLLHESPRRLEELEPKLWKRWAPTILAFPVYDDSDARPAQRTLIRSAYAHAADEVVSSLLVLIDTEGKRDSGGLFVLRRVEGLWDERLDQALAEKAADPAFPPEPAAELLRFLLDHGSGRGHALAESLAPVPPPAAGAERQHAIGAAVLLLSRTDGAFARLWPAFENDRGFGRRVVARIAVGDDRDERRLAPRLADGELATLFSWLAHEYPYSEDRPRLGAAFLGEREQIERFRDSLLTELENRGTQEACRELRRVETRFADLDWLRAIRAGAEERMRRATWRPPSAAEVVALAAEPGRLRFVESGEQLLAVLLESVSRAQRYLHAENAAVVELWHHRTTGVWRPASEPEFSDWLARFFRRDLEERRVIVNREVEVKRPPGAPLGERTDIHVSAVSARSDRPEVIRVIIEVKGCWNAELETALESQLVERYLLGTDNRHGLYIIGWFASTRWDSDHDAKRACERRDRSTVESLLTEQAANAATKTDVVVRVAGLDLTLG
jgi:hypothetical protein